MQGGSTPSTKEPAFWEGGAHSWATPKDLSGLSNPVLLETERRITDAGLTQISSGLLPAGTVLLSSRAPIGYLAVAEVPVAINQGFIAMQPLEGSQTSSCFSGPRSPMTQSSAERTALPSLRSANQISVLSRLWHRHSAVMDAFDRVVRPMYSRIVVNERESRVLRDARDALLPKLISGELRVQQADPFTEEAVR